MDKRKEEVGGAALRRSKVEVARAAFAQNNKEESRLLHASASTPAICERGHKSHAFPTDLRRFVEVALKAGNQGVIVCCVLTSGLEVLAPHINAHVVWPFCMVTLLGLALTLGFLDYINRQAEKTFGENEREREQWECENFIEGEQKEMVELYVSKGMAHDDAVTVIQLLSKNQELFLDIMMAEELGILPYSGLPPHLSGLVTGLGFFVIGALPLVAYTTPASHALLGLPASSPVHNLFFFFSASSSVEGLATFLLLAALLLFALGGVKYFYCIDLEAWWKQGAIMVGLEVAVVLTTLGLGALLRSLSFEPPHAALLHQHTPVFS